MIKRIFYLKLFVKMGVCKKNMIQKENKNHNKIVLLREYFSDFFL